MRGKRKLKVHWVNGVEGREVENKTDQTTKQEKTQHQSTIKPTQENKITTQDGVGE